MPTKTKNPPAKKAWAKADSEPKFPYTTKPGSLRRFLKAVPQRPKPVKFDQDLMRSWGFSSGNDYTVLRVLKAVNLLNGQNEPTPVYAAFMKVNTGASALGPEIRRVYAPLFESNHKPWEENSETLRNLFNINSGGSSGSLDLQIQTFKALCENAAFESADGGVPLPATESNQRGGEGGGPLQRQPIININLHIHLPENKSRREYEDLIEDIGKYIFGRTVGDRL